MNPQRPGLKGWSTQLLRTLVLVILVLAPVAAVPVSAGPPEWVEVIVQAHSKGAAADKVRGHGGEVTHHLGIINAVGARMPKQALKGLMRAPGIRRIFENRMLQIADVGAMVRDEFNTPSFNNNDGIASWAGGWLENDVYGSGPTMGNVQIVNGELRLDDEPDTRTEPSMAREVFLAGTTSATFRFDFRLAHGVDVNADLVVVEVSADGGASYSTLEIINGYGGTWGSRSYDISAYAAASTRIRFRVIQRYGGFDEYFAVDNVQIEYTIEVDSEYGGFAVRDRFNTPSFNNNDGIASWAGDWLENDVYGSGPTTGNVQIVNGELRLDDEPDTGTEPSVAREVFLAGTTSATFRFDFRLGPGVDVNADLVAIEVSADGGASYSTLEIISHYGGTLGSRSYDISDYASANTRIRFRVILRYGGFDEYFAVDNIQIEYGFQDTSYPTVVNADQLHAEGITGEGVAVAVLDTGYWSDPAIDLDTEGSPRVLAYYDAIAGQDMTWLVSTGVDLDPCGHGTHVSSLALSSRRTPDGRYNGIAPDAYLVSVKAFDANGMATYADVIRGIDWVVQHKDVYKIGVLNLSFSGIPNSHYWDDALNQAVMRTWQAGIVVVASAGNRGPEAMTIGVPGNVPYIITAGAFSDNYTPADVTDDILTSFSSAGPTIEGFVKPEIVAPGGHMLGLMSQTATIAQQHPAYWSEGNYFTMSGTSQATAVTSGIAALILQANPGLTPDDVKCRLMAATSPAVDDDGTLAYSIFQQGAGLVNALDAVFSTASSCANQGLNIDNDLAGIEHYGGLANQDPDTGEYYITDLDGYTWSDNSWVPQE